MANQITRKKLPLAGPVVLDSTGRTQRNGGVVPTTPGREQIVLPPGIGRTVNTGGPGQPVQTITGNTGGPSPTTQAPIPLAHTGGPGQPGVTPLSVNTGGPGQVQTLNVHTGGNTPAVPVPGVQTGGPAQPGTAINPIAMPLGSIDGSQYIANPTTGGPSLPLDTSSGWQGGVINVGTTPPVNQVNPGTSTTTTPVAPGQSSTVQAVQTGQSSGLAVPRMGRGWAVPEAGTSGGVVQDYLNNLLDENGSYIQNAARRGSEMASARGMLNGSIAAGASTRSAIEAAQPILDQIMGLHKSREGMSFTQGENSLDRRLQERLQAQNLNFQGQQNDLNRALQSALQAQGFNFEGEQNDLNRGLQAALQAQGFNFEGQQNDLGRALQTALQSQNLNFQGTQNDLQRSLTAQLQAQGFSFEDAQAAAQRMFQGTMDRENRAFQGEQNSLDRIQGVNNALLQGTLQERIAQIQAQIQSNAAQQDFEFRRTLQSDSAAQQDWLRSNAFADQFNANISMIPINNSMDMLQQLTQYALSDPETFTPEVMSGFTTFFNNNMLNLLSQYFPGSVTGGNS